MVSSSVLLSQVCFFVSCSDDLFIQQILLSAELSPGAVFVNKESKSSSLEDINVSCV